MYSRKWTNFNHGQSLIDRYIANTVTKLGLVQD